MSISTPSINTLIQLVESSLSQMQHVKTCQYEDLKQLRACRYELLQEAVKAEQDIYRQRHAPFSRRNRHPVLRETKPAL